MDHIPEQVWETYFARPDGEIPLMSRKLTDLCNKVVSIETKVDKLNGHGKIISTMDRRLTKQEKFCAERVLKEATTQDAYAEKEADLDKVREKERNRTLKMVAIGGFVVAFLTLVFRVTTHFL